MKKRAREHVTETRNALQTFFDELNQGQQKKILRNEVGVDISDCDFEAIYMTYEDYD